MHRPLAELSTDRPTPRKLKVDPKRSEVQPKVTPVRPSQRPASLENGTLSTSKRVVTDSAALRMRDRLKNLNIHGGQSKPESKSAASSRVTSTAQEPRATSHPSTPKTSTGPPGNPSSTLSIAGSGVGRASSVGSARPRKLSHVNGNVRQLDAANGNLGGSDIGSNGDSTGKRQPPKLKRKVPG
jgi:hypothetical protein